MIQNRIMNTANQFFQVIAVTGGKGGIGKSTTTLNLAAGLRQSGRSVLVMDADLGLANIDVMLGLQPKFNLSHVLAGECVLADVILQGPCGINILPAASGLQSMSGLSNAQHNGLISAFSEISSGIDTLIIDTAAGISESVTTYCKAAHEVIVVVCDEPASLADGYAMIKVLHQNHGVHRFNLLVNKAENETDGIKLFKHMLGVIDQFMNIDLAFLGTVPHDYYQNKALQQRKLICEAYPRSGITRAWKVLAKKIADMPVRNELSGNTEFFLERLLNQEKIMEVA